MDAHASRTDHHAGAQRLVFTGLAVNLALGLIKLTAGVLGNSYALVADAVESLADLAGSFIIWGGLRIAARPRSDRHPYGYGKAESLAALTVALLVFAAGVAVAIESVREIVTPHHAPAWWTLLVLLVVVATKETLFRLSQRVQKRTGSSAMAADALHHRADAITSLGAFVGISIALIGGKGWEPADDWAALFASFVILYNAVQLGLRPIRELLDAQDKPTVQAAQTAAQSVPGVALVHKVAARKSGMGYWIDMHIWVNPQMPVVEAHTLAHAVKDAVKAAVPGAFDVLIHVEPAAEVATPVGVGAVARATP